MSVTFTSHVKEALSAEQAARNKALEIIGGKAETYAKKICPVDMFPQTTHVESVVLLSRKK